MSFSRKDLTLTIKGPDTQTGLFILPPGINFYSVTFPYSKSFIMEENKNASNDASQKDSLLDKAEKVWNKVEHEAEEAWNKAKNSEMADKAKEKFEDLKVEAKELYNQAKSGELAGKAKVKFEELKGEAKELYEKARSGELADKAKVKFEDLKEDAKELWNKLANKFDKEENKNTTPPKEGPDA